METKTNKTSVLSVMRCVSAVVLQGESRSCMRSDMDAARAAVAELIEAAQEIPVEYDFHGEPATPEWARFVTALKSVGGVQ